MAKLLMISTDRRIFIPGSDVRMRQVEYAKKWEEVHIIIFRKKSDLTSDQNSHVKNQMSQQEGSGRISDNCWVHGTDSVSPFLYPFDAKRIGKDIIESRGMTEITCQDASLTALSGITLSQKFGLPLEIQIHEDLGSPHYGFRLTNKIRKILARRNIKKADRIRVVSRRIKDYVTGEFGIKEEKIEIRPIATDVDRIRNAVVTDAVNLKKLHPRFEKIVLVASRLEPEKNVALAIEAFSLVLRKMPGSGLVIVGAGSEAPRLRKVVERLGLRDAVVFHGWVDGEKMAAYYKTADLYLNTSLFEGYGMSLVEAKAAGLPIVSTDVGVAREVGASIVPWDADELADAITKILS